MTVESIDSNENYAFFSDWNKDWKPGPYPTTDEERRAAAKKYGLLPEDYKPYPDDGRSLRGNNWLKQILIDNLSQNWKFTGAGLGDYPHLPDIPVEQRDITYPYDNPEMRRNFGEVVCIITSKRWEAFLSIFRNLLQVHAEVDYHDEVHVGTSGPLRYSFMEMATAFFGVMIGSFLLTYWLEDKKMFRPAMPKQLPGDGQKHYTFEPAR